MPDLSRLGSIDSVFLPMWERALGRAFAFLHEVGLLLIIFFRVVDKKQNISYYKCRVIGNPIRFNSEEPPSPDFQ